MIWNCSFLEAFLKLSGFKNIFFIILLSFSKNYLCESMHSDIDKTVGSLKIAGYNLLHPTGHRTQGTQYRRRQKYFLTQSHWKW